MYLRKMIGIILLLVFSNLYADPPETVGQGAEQYDWETCFHDKESECLNGCQISDNVDCGSNCKTLARDKCIEQGLTPP